VNSVAQPLLHCIVFLLVYYLRLFTV